MALQTAKVKSNVSRLCQNSSKPFPGPTFRKVSASWTDVSAHRRTHSLRYFAMHRRKIMDSILEPTVAEAKSLYGQVYENHAGLMRFLKGAGMPIPGLYTPLRSSS